MARVWLVAPRRRSDLGESPAMALTIPELFEAAAAEVPEKPWLLYEDEAFTYAQARERIGRGAAALAELGAGPGDLVLATARNRPKYVFTWLAAMYLGAIHVAVDPRSTESELAGLAGQVEPKLVVDDGNVDGLFTRAAPPLAGPGPARPDDPAVLIPTSGTTGRSKLVTQTHRAYAMAGEGFPWWLELTPEDRLMTSLPLFHLNAPAYSVLGSVAARASLVLLPGFSARTFIDSARRHGATEFNAIGAMLEILMRQPERPDDADNPLRLCYAGPAPERERQEQIEQRFGIRIVVGYAMSESPYGLVWPHGRRPFGTLGSARQHPYLGTINEAKVVKPGDADGEPGASADAELGPGETGEILLRNPVITPGYWGMPEETLAAKTADGWLHTG